MFLLSKQQQWTHQTSVLCSSLLWGESCHLLVSHLPYLDFPVLCRFTYYSTGRRVPLGKGWIYMPWHMSSISFHPIFHQWKGWWNLLAIWIWVYRSLFESVSILLVLHPGVEFWIIQSLSLNFEAILAEVKEPNRCLFTGISLNIWFAVSLFLFLVHP